MCSIPAHDKQQPTYVDDVDSGVGRAIPNHSTTAALEPLGAALNFIHCWLKLFNKKYEVR